MRKIVLLIGSLILSILALEAKGNDTDKGFTVTYLMLEKHNIALPQDQLQEDANLSEKEIKQIGGDYDR